MQSRQTSPQLASEWISDWNQLSRQMRRQLGERYAQVGMSESKAAVLQALSNSSAYLTQSDLADELSLSESNLCNLVERMRSEGLLERERSVLDRRKSVLTLTPAGKEQCRGLAQIHEDYQTELLTHLAGTDQPQLQRFIQELGRCLQAMEAAPLAMRRTA